MGLAICTRCRKLSSKRLHIPSSITLTKCQLSEAGECSEAAGGAASFCFNKDFRSRRKANLFRKTGQARTVSIVTVLNSLYSRGGRVGFSSSDNSSSRRDRSGLSSPDLTRISSSSWPNLSSMARLAGSKLGQPAPSASVSTIQLHD